MARKPTVKKAEPTSRQMALGESRAKLQVALSEMQKRAEHAEQSYADALSHARGMEKRANEAEQRATLAQDEAIRRDRIIAHWEGRFAMLRELKTIPDDAALPQWGSTNTYGDNYRKFVK